MKKFKIFLLLSILLCFGFMLNSEVHAQSNGPKAFEIGDVLPQGLVKITGQFYSDGEIFIYLSSDYTNLFMSKSEDDDDFAFGNSFDSFLVEDNTDYSSGSINAIFDFSSLSESERTFNSGYYDGGNKVYWEEYIAGYSITFEENGGTEQTDLSDVTALPDPLPIPTKAHHVFTGWYYDNLFTQKANAGDELTANVILYAKWEQLATNAKIFEVGDILPAGNIKISWDFTGRHIDLLHVFSILGDSESDDVLNIEISSYGDSGSIIIIFINDNEFFVNEPGGTILTLTEPITIYTVEGYETYDYEPIDYYEYIDDALLWEVVSQDYLDGYEDGYAYAGVSYELGRKHAREIYGYYDPITEQWLSVSEYLSLYGTDKMGQSDFYNNFDKYFIPAMIIVFGGAIVLTILKVFKGREQ